MDDGMRFSINGTNLVNTAETIWKASAWNNDTFCPVRSHFKDGQYVDKSQGNESDGYQMQNILMGSSDQNDVSTGENTRKVTQKISILMQ